MVHRARPTRSTVRYGSLLQARPSRYGLQFSDRMAVCPLCSATRRVDLNDIFYTHLSGETRMWQSYMEWVDCAGSGRAAELDDASSTDDLLAVAPEALSYTWDENLARKKQLEDLAQMRCDHLVATVVQVRDVESGFLVRAYRDAITAIKAENEFLQALLSEG
jgi:hypothetical protein